MHSISHRVIHRVGILCLAGWMGVLGMRFVVGGQGAGSAETVSFNFDVRPLLSDRCFSCHGPDERTRKAGLRLDTEEGLLGKAGHRSRPAVVIPGHPAESELYRRITAADADDLMPPLASQLTLSEAERERIRRWIEDGAVYESHWAFRPLARPMIPRFKGTLGKGASPLDAFVWAGLNRQGRRFAPEASRERWIRRVSMDLTGLPPNSEEAAAFLNDASPRAYERVVDRLLASPAYGEWRANEWMDLARYADTYGYQADVERDMSPWRDWVIRAFNQNLPYDRFIEWQIAGDLLPDASRDQVLATAFNRLHRQTNEGGSIEEEFRTEYVADRVNTFGSAFLGLTLECARCHDHKYDPLTQRDYYRLFAFFNQVDESGLYSHFTMATPTPTLLLYGEGVEDAHRKLKLQIQDQEEEVERWVKRSANDFRAWLATSPRVARPVPKAWYDFELLAGDQTPDRMRTNASAILVDGPIQVEGKIGRGLRFSGDNHVVCKGSGEFGRTAAFSLGLWIRPEARSARAVVLHRSRAWTDSGSRGYELVLEEGRPAFGLIHFWPGNAIQVRGIESLPLGIWSHLLVTYDGSSRAEGLRIYRDGELCAVEVVRDHLYKDIVHRKAWGDADVEGVELTLAGRFRDAGFKEGILDEVEVFDQSLSPVEARLVAGKPTTGLVEEAWREHYRLREMKGPRSRSAASALLKLREEENVLVNDVPEIMVMREKPGGRPTHVLKRGAYDAPGDRVDAGTPTFLFEMPADWPRDRRGLARWLVDRRNPLTARVVVNRVWRTHFGRGLVATAEDFGSQGQLPTHPELLDYLAWEFREDGWDLKRLHRRIVLSRTYRQSSEATAEMLAWDPDNRWLGRGPSHRLAAEQIRDSALAVSGLLDRRIGGRSVRPYQPKGVWEESGTGKTYVQDHGADLYRRSLYTFWRRTAPPPSMLSFDATSREVCTVRRESTSTPLQALVLMNDPQFLEAARVLAERVLMDSAEPMGSGFERLFERVLGRTGSEREQEILARLFREQQAVYSKDPAAAEALLNVGERRAVGGTDRARLAAMAMVVSALMNHDEFVMKR